MLSIKWVKTKTTAREKKWQTELEKAEKAAREKAIKEQATKKLDPNWEWAISTALKKAEKTKIEQTANRVKKRPAELLKT